MSYLYPGFCATSIKDGLTFDIYSVSALSATFLPPYRILRPTSTGPATASLEAAMAYPASVRVSNSQIKRKSYVTDIFRFNWALEICADDNGKGASVLGSMYGMAYAVQAWPPLLIWQQVDALEYRKGFITVTAHSVALIGRGLSTKVLYKQQKAR